jgi:hypothetical protein
VQFPKHPLTAGGQQQSLTFPDGRQMMAMGGLDVRQGSMTVIM